MPWAHTNELSRVHPNWIVVTEVERVGLASVVTFENSFPTCSTALQVEMFPVIWFTERQHLNLETDNFRYVDV